jgi:hypothetical protein
MLQRSLEEGGTIIYQDDRSNSRGEPPGKRKLKEGETRAVVDLAALL